MPYIITREATKTGKETENKVFNPKSKRFQKDSNIKCWINNEDQLENVLHHLLTKEKYRAEELNIERFNVV